MSDAVAVICEFDPLHAGHKRIIDEAKEQGDVTLAVMSGNFTQRSRLSSFDKYSRAEAAIRCGCDAVLELPFPWSCSSAEFFALGGVGIAIGVGADKIVFGSESGDSAKLCDAAALALENRFFSPEGDDPTVGAARAVSDAYLKMGFDFGKNDRLGVEYIKAALRQDRSDVSFHTIKRIPWRSAEEIREMIEKGGLGLGRDYIDPDAFDVYSSDESVMPSRDALENIEYMFFRFFSSGGFDGIFEAEGGVGNRLTRAADTTDPKSFFSAAATKKYTNSRLRRAALFSLLGVRKDDVEKAPPFTYLLAADKKGCDYLKKLDSRPLRILTKPSDADDTDPGFARSLALCRKADELFSLCVSPPLPSGFFIKKTPYIEL